MLELNFDIRDEKINKKIRQLKERGRNKPCHTNYSPQECKNCMFYNNLYYISDNTLYPSGQAYCNYQYDIKELNGKGCYNYQEIFKPDVYNGKIDLALTIKSLDESIQFYIEELNDMKKMLNCFLEKNKDE